VGKKHYFGFLFEFITRRFSLLSFRLCVQVSTIYIFRSLTSCVFGGIIPHFMALFLHEPNLGLGFSAMVFGSTFYIWCVC